MNMDTEEIDLLDISDWNQASDHLHLFDHTPDHEGTSRDHLQHLQQAFPQQQLGLTSANGNTTNPAVLFGIKKNVIPTITTIYEPKFFEIYQAYLTHQHQFEPDVNNLHPGQQHLVTLCLNNLLCFSNWARDSTTGNWIRATLFENPDMRPEVRNGLAMILVYTFSAAKAADLRNLNPTSNATIDMFTVLMKTDSGMGIVNKTSLKIYSDPFGYFNFLKTCISGLIDASAIPENERVNNQTKKTRRGSKNRDEVEAFNYVKNSIVAMLQSPDSLQLARDRIHQILQFWHVKGKSIRNERFSCVFSLPPPPVGSSLNANPSALKVSDDNSTMVSTSNGPGEFIGRGSGVSLGNRSSGGSLSIDTTSVIANANAHTPLGMGQQHGQGYPMPGASVAQNGASVAVLSQANMDNDSASVNSDSVSSCSRSPYPSFSNRYSSSSAAGMAMMMVMGPGGASSASAGQGLVGQGGANGTVGSERESGSGASFFDLSNLHSLSKHPHMALLHQAQSQSAMQIPVPAWRFDRIGGLRWNVTSTFLYDFDALQHCTHAHRTAFYLVDEVRLKNFLIDLMTQALSQSQQSMPPQGFADSISQGIFQLSLSYLQAATGLSSIEKILLKSNSVLTSWSQLDFTQLKIFVDGWKLQTVHAQQKIETRPQRLSNSQVSLTSNMDDMDNVSVASASASLVASVSEGFHIGSSAAGPDVSSASGSLPRRISRRRTTGGVEMKRDLVKLQQLHETRGQTQTQSAYPLPGTSPSVASSPPFGAFPTYMTMESNQPFQHSPSMRESERKTSLGSTVGLSLIEYWQSLHNSSVPSGNGNSGSNGSFSANGNGGRGVIIYERSSEVGLIVRANPKYNIPEDLWCLYYPEDAMEQFSHHLANLSNSGQPSNPLDYSFAAFLCTLLPQTREIFRHLQTSQPRHGFGGYANPMSAITIGYYPHHIDTKSSNPFLSISQMGPPPSPGTSSQYRTVGNIDHPFHQILSKFSSESFFHDVTLV